MAVPWTDTKYTLPAASTTVVGGVKYGTTEGTACQGNDSRLSDSRRANGGNSDTVDNLHANAFGRAYSANNNFGGSQSEITTAQFITLLTNLGAFNQPYWCARGSWSYASNNIINDTGIGKIHLAGCTVEVMGNSSNYTIRIITPSTSSGGGETKRVYYYVYNGPTYSPSWFKSIRSDEFDALKTRVTNVENELNGVSAAVTSLESAAQ